jgi:hypothetical protein
VMQSIWAVRPSACLPISGVEASVRHRISISAHRSRQGRGNLSVERQLRSNILCCLAEMSSWSTVSGKI